VLETLPVWARAAASVTAHSEREQGEQDAGDGGQLLSRRKNVLWLGLYLCKYQKQIAAVAGAWGSKPREEAGFPNLRFCGAGSQSLKTQLKGGG
jgi:hypothetical protein